MPVLPSYGNQSIDSEKSIPKSIPRNRYSVAFHKMPGKRLQIRSYFREFENLKPPGVNLP